MIVGKKIVQQFINAESENRLLKKALDAINSGVVIHDREGHIIYTNRAASPVVDKLKKTPIKEWASLLNLKRLDHTPISVDDMPLMKTLKTGRSHVDDLIISTDEDKSYIINVRAIPMLDKNNQLVGVMVIYYDVTQIKQRESQLETALYEKKLLFTAIESTSDIVVITDFYGKLIYFNKAARNILYGNKKIKNPIPIDLKDYHTPESWQKMQQSMIPEALKTGSATGELTLVDREGQKIFVSQVLVCKKNEKGRVEFFASISRDISALVAKEELVKKQQAYIQEILDANPNAIFVKDSNSIYQFVNKKFCEINGKEASKTLGKSDFTLFGRNKSTIRYRKDDLKIIKEKATLITTEEVIFNQKSNSIRWFQTIKTPIVSIDGKSTHILGVATDITSLKNSECSLKNQLRLNELISTIATDFLHAPHTHIDKVIVRTLKTICTNTPMTRAIVNVTGINSKIRYMHVWSKHRQDPLYDGRQVLKQFSPSDFKWIYQRLHEKGYAFSGDMPDTPDTLLEKETMQKIGIKSFLIIRLNTKHYQESYLNLSAYEKVNLTPTDFAFINTISQIMSIALERAHTERALYEKLRLEHIITQISTHFVDIDTAKIPKEINRALKSVARTIGADQVYLFHTDTQIKKFHLVSYWFKNRTLPDFSVVQDVQAEDYEWALQQLKKDLILSIPATEVLPDESGIIKQLFNRQQVKSALGIPLFIKGKFYGAMVFASFDREYFWSDESVPMLKLLGQVLANVLERKRSEEKLRESEKLYRTLAGNIPRSAVLLFDTNLRLTVVEGKLLDEWEYDKASLEGKPIYEIFDFTDAMAATDLSSTRTLYQEVLEGKEFQFEKQINARNYHFNIFPIRNEEKEIVSGMLMAIDITEFTEIQKKLERQARELQSSNEDLEQFAYAASHDLQEPLRMVSSYVYLIEKKLGNNLSADVKEFMFFVTDGVKRMQQLINDLLEYSRVERKGKEFTAVDMNEVIRAVMFNLYQVINENKAVINYPDHLPVVTGDFTQIVSLLQNLVDNSIKFRKNDSPVIEIGYQAHRQHYTFYVKDNGIGIDQKYFDRIFVIFQRLNNRNQYPGTGIGLAICKKIVERHGGKIWVESQSGIGTTFYFELKKA